MAIGRISVNKKSRKCRCMYEPAGLNIELYHKKPKTVGANILPLYHSLRTNAKAQASKYLKILGKKIFF